MEETRRTCARELARVDVRVGVQVLAVHANAHDDLFHRRIARSLAETVDGALDLLGAVLHARERKRRCHAEVIVAVHGDLCAMDAVHVVHQELDTTAELVRERIPGRVRDVHDRRPCLDNGLDNLGQEFVVGTPRVLGVELDVLAEVAGIRDGLYGTLDAGGFVNAQLIVDMAFGHADAGMDARPLGIAKRVGGGIDILLHRAGERADRRVLARELRDTADALEVARAGDREARFDDVDVQLQQLARDHQFFLGVHGSARRLLAVAQRRVEDVDLAGHARISFLSLPPATGPSKLQGRAGLGRAPEDKPVCANSEARTAASPLSRLL